MLVRAQSGLLRKKKNNMYKIIVNGRTSIEFPVSEKELDNAKSYYGEGAFYGHTLKEQMDLAAIYKTKIGSYFIKEKTKMLKDLGLNWELINSEGQVIL